MTADELGGRVDHNIGSMLNGTENDGRESIIYNDYDVVFVCYFCNGVQICHVAVGVAECFHIDGFCVGTNGCFEGFQVIHVYDSVCNALCAERVGNQVVGTTVQVVGCYDVVAILCNVLQSVGDGSGTRCHSKASYAAFKSSYTVFEHALGGIGQTSVDVTSVAQTKAVSCMLGVVEHV